VKTVRTLIIEREIPFEVVGKTWVIGPDAFRRLKAAAADHARKAKSLGVGSPSGRRPEPAAVA
jgi:hypothetical protein